MADLKKSDVSGRVDGPEKFTTFEISFSPSSSTEQIDVHEDDSPDAVVQWVEEYMTQWRGFFTEL